MDVVRDIHGWNGVHLSRTIGQGAEKGCSIPFMPMICKAAPGRMKENLDIFILMLLKETVNAVFQCSAKGEPDRCGRYLLFQMVLGRTVTP